MKMKTLFFLALILVCVSCNNSRTKPEVVPQEVMQEIYEEIKTPYKYGLVLTGTDLDKMTDCPTIFLSDGKWYMYYFVFDGRGYETWMAVSDDLLNWATTGRVLSFSDENDWDCPAPVGVAIIPSKNTTANTG